MKIRLVLTALLFMITAISNFAFVNLAAPVTSSEMAVSSHSPVCGQNKIN